MKARISALEGRESVLLLGLFKIESPAPKRRDGVNVRIERELR
jgi:hypothetical protein